MAVERNPNSYIRGYVEDEAQEWEHRQVAQTIYEWADVFRYYFFAARDVPQRGLPQPLIAIEEMRVEILAAYRLRENPNGLPYEIIMNARYLGRPLWETLESELHEMTHLLQETTPGMQSCKGGYHNAQFVAMANEMGLYPRLGSGAHWHPADGQFERLMERYQVPKPEHAQGDFNAPPADKKKAWWDEDRGKRKGSSTLRLYLCGCEPPFKVRTGRSDLAAICLRCEKPFLPAAAS